MRFLVDLYRLIVLSALALGIIGASYLAFLLLMSEQSTSEFNGFVIAAMIIGGIGVVLTIGITATFISMHDRFGEIADQSRRIADSLERLGSAEQHSSSEIL